MDRSFQKKGYKIIRNIIPHHLLNNMILVIAKRFSEITKIKLNDGPIVNSKVSKELEVNLLDLRINRPDIFAFLYDSVQSCVSLNQLLTYKKLINVLCKISGNQQESFSTSGHVQRIDAPNDNKNLYDWHQETSYYRQSSSGENCFFIWIPIFDAGKKNGSILLAEESHKEGYIETKLKKKDKFSSEQRTINKKRVKKYKIILPKINRGDACIVHFNILHKSGVNLTNNFKYTAIGRYHFTNTPAFKPFRYKVKLNELMSKKK